MSLIKNNAKVAAQIAVELAKLQSPSGEPMHVSGGGGESTTGRPLVIGGSILDVHYHVRDDNLEVSCKTLISDEARAENFHSKPLEASRRVVGGVGWPRQLEHLTLISLFSIPKLFEEAYEWKISCL